MQKSVIFGGVVVLAVSGYVVGTKMFSSTNNVSVTSSTTETQVSQQGEGVGRNGDGQQGDLAGMSERLQGRIVAIEDNAIVIGVYENKMGASREDMRGMTQEEREAMRLEREQEESREIVGEQTIALADDTVIETGRMNGPRGGAPFGDAPEGMDLPEDMEPPAKEEGMDLPDFDMRDAERTIETLTRSDLVVGSDVTIIMSDDGSFASRIVVEGSN